MKLVSLHDDKIPVGYLIDCFMIGNMQGFHERSYLTKKGIIPCYLDFAIIPPTFFAKDDSIIKFCTEMSE